MRTSARGIELIKRFEGFSSIPYADAAGFMTIGYGHCIKEGEIFTSLTEQQACDLLAKDLIGFEQAIDKQVKISLLQPQFDALASLIFNIGAQAFEKSYLLRLLNAGDIDGAARQFDRWVYAGGRKLPGLIARRAAEKLVFLSVTQL